MQCGQMYVCACGVVSGLAGWLLGLCGPSVAAGVDCMHRASGNACPVRAHDSKLGAALDTGWQQHQQEQAHQLLQRAMYWSPIQISGEKWCLQSNEQEFALSQIALSQIKAYPGNQATPGSCQGSVCHCMSTPAN